MNNALPTIVSEYRTQQNLSLRAFAESITNGLPQDGISHQTVANWENGVHGPSFVLLMLMTKHFDDWHRDFALDCMAAIYPEYYDPATQIGRAALAGQALEQNTEEGEK